MKTFKFIVVGMFLFFAVVAKAQISVHVDLGSPPQWGPSGYSDVRYYYLPDVEAYYDVPSSMFIYFNGVSWVRRAYLPSRYRDYDLYSGYKVVMSDYRGNTPYSHFREHKRQYTKGYRGEEQHSIGRRPEGGNYNDRNYSRSRYNQRYNRDNQGYNRDNQRYGRDNQRQRYNRDNQGYSRDDRQGDRRGNDRYKGKGKDRGKGDNRNR